MGCASTIPRSVPANLTQPCAAVNPIEEGATMGDLLRASVEVIYEYNECAARHAALSDLVKEK